MDSLHLHTHWVPDVTLIPNRFLDEYMPRANGEFVKIYLYLLRSAPGELPSLSQLADKMDCTERDILRAVRYWEKEGLLTLGFNENQELTDLSFSYPKEKAEAAATPEIPEPVGTSVSADVSPDENSLTAERVKELKENEQIVQLLYIAEQYLGRPLSITDTNKILYFYEELNFDPDLIEYLIEYCVSRGRKSIWYIQSIALSWSDQGISTVAAAKEEARQYSQTYYAVLKALGIQNHNPIEGEVEIIDRWIQEWGFTMELIREACKRAVLQTGSGSIRYTNSILNSWHEADVHHLSDVKKLDADHDKLKQAQARQARSAAKNSGKHNQFNDYPHRDYDFDEIKKSMFQQ